MNLIEWKTDAILKNWPRHQGLWNGFFVAHITEDLEREGIRIAIHIPWKHKKGDHFVGSGLSGEVESIDAAKARAERALRSFLRAARAKQSKK